MRGLIGYGSWAQRLHIPSIAMSAGATLAAVCGPDEGRARQLASEHGARLGTADYRAVIARPDVDAVLIASPNDTHAQIAIAAARAGKAVLCEKPLATTLADARRMTAAVREAGVTGMVAFTWRNVPAAQLAQATVASGGLGRLFHVAGYLLHGRWLALDTRRPWRFDRRRAGSGILGDLAVHVFDLLEMITGQAITRVCAGLATFGPKPDVAGQQPVFDDGQILLEFAGKTRGTVRVSRVAASAGRPPYPEMHSGIEIYGEKGALIHELHRHSGLELRRPGEAARLLDAPDPLPASDDEWVVTREIGRRQIERFAAAVLAKRPAEPDFTSGLRAQAVVDACERSHDRGAWTDVEPV
jgi:predicted dehydrogenase